MILQEKTKESVTKPADIFNIVSSLLKVEDEGEKLKEHLWSIGLDSRSRVVYVELVSLGTLDETLIHPREVFRNAIVKGASRVALAHNHPSGEVQPSEADIVVTERLVEAGKILGIALIDHVIVTEDQFHSLKATNQMGGDK